MTPRSATITDRLWSACANAMRATADGSLRIARRLLFPVGRVPVAPTRILVHLVGNIGDIVVATPMLQALSDLHPDAHVTLLTSAGRGGNPGAASVLRSADSVDEIIEYDVDAGAADRWALAKLLRSEHPDLMVLCPASLTGWRHNVRNLLFARLVGPRFVIGSTVPVIRMGLPAQVRVRRWFPHETLRYLALLDELGDLPPRRVVDLGPMSPASIAKLEQVTPESGFVAICPGGKQVQHRWPEARFAEIVASLAVETNRQFVMIGNEAERDLCDRVLRDAGNRGVNAAGLLDVRESAVLLSRADLLISNDTGPMHLAAISDTPIVAVFGGAMPPGLWYPLTSRATVLRRRGACSSCLGRPDSTHCVEQIPVAAVLEACRTALTRGQDVGGSPHCRLMPSDDAARPMSIEPTRTGWIEVDAAP